MITTSRYDTRPVRGLFDRYVFSFLGTFRSDGERERGKIVTRQTFKIKHDTADPKRASAAVCDIIFIARTIPVRFFFVRGYSSYRSLESPSLFFFIFVSLITHSGFEHPVRKSISRLHG